MKNSQDLALHEALQLMDSEKSTVFITELEESIREALYKTKGGKIARVESAVLLTQEEKQQIEKLLEKVLQRKLEVIFKINPQFMAGFKIIVGDWKLDATLSNQLDLLRRTLGGVR